MSQEQNKQQQDTQETMYDISVAASLAITDERVQQTGSRFTLPDGRQIAVWLMPELIDERVAGEETYTDISWEEAAALGVHLNEYLETEINER
ncbi:hypothetical protein Deipr_2412 (plasmid) [Deinococcus proteolyticus MRP]|uniref:Uncharacterized protein n=1 Tax=Deinococcus proteolyticus (strain ATCC 35074 / DSM 20540 / JCM 6276 / NBRC 101906 / NCIMB 13154 / VKM Ac-1939 / CCM 2703 / MRP) TaxID=693977 RepID=F0RQH7_DEIPM|nr:hypothetical protein [Deinococcus proteolyticus]ADY27536.1 hypothetical protein Deipr_2412 [Deinococcus proteolyticus MRP]